MIFLLLWVVVRLVFSINHIKAVLCMLIFSLNLSLLLALLVFVMVLRKVILCDQEIIIYLLYLELARWYLVINMVCLSLQFHFLTLVDLFLTFKSFNLSIYIISVHDRIPYIFVFHFEFLYFIFAFLQIIFSLWYLFLDWIFGYSWYIWQPFL